VLLMVAKPLLIPEELKRALKEAERVAVLTGAGTSAESGVPTFRDAQTGLWARYDPQELATPEAFRKDPKLVWDWYRWRRDLVQAAHPNPGHYALAKIAGLVPELALITQNVDGLHQKAGSPEVIELHGNILRTRCSREDCLVESWQENDQALPICPKCGAYLRPDVVWFGENLPHQALEDAWLAACTCQVFLSIGTSSLVEPAASLPGLAQGYGALVVEINPNLTPLTPHADFILPAPSGVALPALLEAVWG
jgi:NAD-dependent deacetylase